MGNNKKDGFSRPVIISVELLFGYQYLSAAHVGTQYLGNGHGAVGLQMVLKIRDEHARRRDNGIVERMGRYILPSSPLTRIFRRRA